MSQAFLVSWKRRYAGWTETVLPHLEVIRVCVYVRGDYWLPSSLRASSIIAAFFHILFLYPHPVGFCEVEHSFTLIPLLPSCCSALQLLTPVRHFSWLSALICAWFMIMYCRIIHQILYTPTGIMPPPPPTMVCNHIYHSVSDLKCVCWLSEAFCGNVIGTAAWLHTLINYT